MEMMIDFNVIFLILVEFGIVFSLLSFLLMLLLLLLSFHIYFFESSHFYFIYFFINFETYLCFVSDNEKFIV